jgi:hypothetical protein
MKQKQREFALRLSLNQRNEEGYMSVTDVDSMNIEGSKFNVPRMQGSTIDDDEPEINLENEISQVRGRIARAIDDMKFDTDVMFFSPHPYNRDLINTSLVPPVIK